MTDVLCAWYAGPSCKLILDGGQSTPAVRNICMTTASRAARRVSSSSALLASPLGWSAVKAPFGCTGMTLAEASADTLQQARHSACDKANHKTAPSSKQTQPSAQQHTLHAWILDAPWLRHSIQALATRPSCHQCTFQAHTCHCQKAVSSIKGNWAAALA